MLLSSVCDIIPGSGSASISSYTGGKGGEYANIGVVGFSQRVASQLILDELLLKTGEYGIARLSINWRENMSNFKLKDYDIHGKEIVTLAIERDDNTLSFPGEKEMLLEGARLLCYGKLTELPVSGFHAT